MSTDLLARAGHPPEGTGRPGQPFSIEPGNVIITAATAARIRAECSLPIQRRRSERGALHVKRFVEVISRGLWLDFSQITFGVTPDIRFYLLNGYHRLDAVVESGRPQSFNIVLKKCQTDDDVLSAYSQYDRPGLARIRSDTDATNAIGFADSLGVSKVVARALWRATPIIRNGMRPVHVNDIAAKVEMAVLEIRAAAAMEWKPEIGLYNSVVGMATGGTFRRKLISPSVVAVALQTLRHAKGKALEFWTNVARNDGLRAGTPEHTLVRVLMERRFEAGDDENLIIPALAWNAFFQGRNLTRIQSGTAGPLRILGTPIGRGGDR